MQQPFTQDDIKRMEQYAKLAQAYQQLENFQKKIEDLQDTLKSRTLNPEAKQEWQKQLAETQGAQQRFEKYLQDNYQAKSPLELDTKMRGLEPTVEKIYQQNTALQQEWQHQLAQHYEPAAPQQQSQSGQQQGKFAQMLEQAHDFMQERQQQRQATRAQDTSFQQFYTKNMPASQQQQASQPMSNQELVKKLQDLDKTIQEYKQALAAEAEKGKAYSLSDNAKQYAERQVADAKVEIQNLNQWNAARLERIGPIPSTYKELDDNMLMEKIKEIRKESLHAKFKEAEDRQKEQEQTKTKSR